MTSTSSIAAIVQQRLGVDLAGFAGATASGEIPVREEIVNRLLADRLARHPHLASVRVQPLDGDVAVVHVVPRARLMPAVRLDVRIERQPRLPDDPTLFLRWTLPAAGPLGFLAGRVASYFGTLPRGIGIDGDIVALNVRQLLAGHGLEDALRYVRSLEIHTRPGAFVARFALAV